ncbi:MAG: hypothetical protein WAW00_02560 [Candidatus Moraniibacteriota bacterium]
MTQKTHGDVAEGDLAQSPRQEGEGGGIIRIAPGLDFDPEDTRCNNFNIEAQQSRPPLNRR